MSEQSRRLFLRTAAAGALTGGAILLPGGVAEAADRRDRHRHHDHDHDQHGHGPDHHHRDHHGHGHHPAPGGSQPPGSPPPGSGATTYSLTVVNNSTQFEDFTVYQGNGGSGGPNLFSLAWLAAPAWPSTSIFFTWTLDYQFVWSQTGPLQPGVDFRAQQSVPADPSDPSQQMVQFTYQQGAFRFTPVQGGGTPGNLYIREDSTIPPSTAAVGIGMSGAPAFALQAQPNVNVVFTPHPEYWLAAGTFQQGEVLDVTEITNAVQIAFPAGVFSLTATLNPDNTWTVRSS